MRIRAFRFAAGLLLTCAAYACYSSIAPVPRLDPDALDSGGPDPGPPTDASCPPRKPWEGPGVTAVLPNGGRDALVINGDRYFLAEIDTTGTGAALGRIVTWKTSGALRDLWSAAPAAVGQRPWEDPGVTAAYISKTNGQQVIISTFRRWVHTGNEMWPVVGSVVDDWIINDAGPPPLDGQAAPWEGPGVTATYFTPTGAQFYAISRDKTWVRRTSDPQPLNWTWQDAGFLAEMAPWTTAPPIAGQRLYEGRGVTAAYYVGTRLFVMSADRMWVYDGTSWVSSGMLSTTAGWSNAPAAACPN